MNGTIGGGRRLSARERWPAYLAGVAAEAAFILGLALVAWLLAVVVEALV
jgi:hypothetical protein